MSTVSTMETIERKASVLESDLKDLEASMTFTLADAMREGSSVTEQCIGNWSDDEGRVCALSAALISLKARRLV